jgi:hypothetical protein
MRIALFALALGFLGLQTVAFTDCCCPEICAHQQGFRNPVGAAPSNDQGCCDGASNPAPPDEAGCIHLQPSSDVVVASTAVNVHPVAAVVALVPEAVRTPFEAETLPYPALLRPARGRRLLFLLDSGLLI